MLLGGDIMVFYVTAGSLETTQGTPDIFINNDYMTKLNNREMRKAILKLLDTESALVGTLGVQNSEVFEDRKNDKLPEVSTPCMNGGTSFENRL